MNDLELEVVSRWNQGQSQRGIARDLGISRDRIRGILSRQKEGREKGLPHPDLPKPAAPRPSQLDAYQEQIDALLARYPNITAMRVFQELRHSGYSGGYSIVRDRIRQQRPRPKKESVVRFETPPGWQAQMDYATYYIDFTTEGRRRVELFSYLLAYSRRQYLHFTESQDFETTLREHVRAFEDLGGVAATCLYDNFKVVVQRWEYEQPLYNTRFLAFAAHYGFRPVACRPRRPQTKGKVERPFAYVEASLLNGRTFRSLDHLNEVTRWWLANVADVREHRTTKKRPIDAHAEELPHLLALPAHHYDTAKVLYRLVSPDGFVDYRANHYSVPWNLAGQLLPVRITEDRLMVYDQRINLLVDHPLFSASITGQKRQLTEHRPPKNQRVRLEWIQARFAELGEVGSRFLEGLIRAQRYHQQQAEKVLLLRRFYRREDLLAALERAVRYHAFSLEAVERILAAQATPQPTWKHLSADQEELLKQLSQEPPTQPRPTSEYQHLLFDPQEPGDAPDKTDQARQENNQAPDNGPDGLRADSESAEDLEDPNDG
jgi:transposase/DNA-binding transcriptional MerR regulator